MPAGTEVWAGDEKVGDLLAPGDRVVVAEGGRGGRGNAGFTSAVNRFPLLAEEGDPGQRREIRLELKLLADVGIVGAPNAGKSTLLARVSSARPRIASYPFSTLEPVLGVVEWREVSFVMVDVPGLIEGAHAGAGLGHQFLRHAERTRLLVHLVDGAADRPVEAYGQVREEIRQYGGGLETKREIVAVTKMDLPGAAARVGELEQTLAGGAGVKGISAATGDGIDELLGEVAGVLAELQRGARTQAPAVEPPVLRPRGSRRGPTVVRRGRAYQVRHRPAERLAAMVDREDGAAMLQLLDQFRRRGVIAALENAGIRPGDKARVGAVEWEWE